MKLVHYGICATGLLQYHMNFHNILDNNFTGFNSKPKQNKTHPNHEPILRAILYVSWLADDLGLCTLFSIQQHAGRLRPI